MARRSVLFSPGDEPELMRKAPATGADTVVFDLEDAVAPERKAAAREAVNGVLTDPSFDPDCEVCVRVNPDREAAIDDIEGIAAGSPRIDSVMLPKAESAGDVYELSEAIEGHGHGYDLPVLAICESAQGILNAEAIAGADPVGAVLFGAEDLAADVGATRTEEGIEVSHARQHVVLAAGAAGVDAIDTLVTDIEATDRLREETAFARRLGYDGKIAIHPAQVGVINGAFTPEPEEIEWARTVLSAAEEADASGRGVFRVDGEMIDAPLIARAEDIVERHRAAADDV
ncbi:CoA ester lyase [Natronomonas sp. F2-12]|jgi:citrate lyase subunit beta/citryl-CoA lyase|uniref:CoA ester lyase n=1 Tax=Natronomonas aquatica TaxID=2841590 RepID=A0A9R1D535_9EURY|nr:CoA ester lyase [Natronomonas aquatica]MCQ4332651.1 CoA ester lyase [Natronomonas aquatica]